MVKIIPQTLIAVIFVILSACTGSNDDQDSVQYPTLSKEQMESAIALSEGKSIDELINLEQSMTAAGSLFIEHCASCHGNTATGKKGIPDLTKGVFSWGSDQQSIYTTIAKGRHGVMQAFGRTLGEVDQGQIVAYVQSLSDPSKRNTLAEYGEVLFKEHCIACHGSDGKGIIPGASNLADDHWQHGSAMMNIRLAIVRGVEGQCPGYKDILNDTQIKLLTAYTIGLSSS